MGPEKPIRFGRVLIIDLLKSLKMFFTIWMLSSVFPTESSWVKAPYWWN